MSAGLARPDRCVVMGVLNVTPDSFSDGGRYADLDAAVAHGVAMHRDSADLVDVGGESTRPGADPVPADEELRRTLPVVESRGEIVWVAGVAVDERFAASEGAPGAIALSARTTH